MILFPHCPFYSLIFLLFLFFFLFYYADPFESSKDYFASVADGLVVQALEKRWSSPDEEGAGNRFSFRGPLIFRRIVRDTGVFDRNKGPFPFNYMDMGIQNLLANNANANDTINAYNDATKATDTTKATDGLALVAVIDREMDQSSPWQVFYYPMPIPLVSSDQETAEILSDCGHPAYGNVARQVAARMLYRQGFSEAERALETGGCPLRCSISGVLEEDVEGLWRGWQGWGVSGDGGGADV